MKKVYEKSLCWLRRDLRLHDHHALSEATRQSEKVYLVFVFDPKILKVINDKNDQRLGLIYDSLQEIKSQAPLIILHGDPQIEIPKLIEELKIEALFFNRAYSPYSRTRDQKITTTLITKNIDVFQFKDTVGFDGNELLTNQGTPFKVFTPYKRAWIQKFHSQDAVIPNYRVDIKKITAPKKEKNITLENFGLHYQKPHLKAGTNEALKRLKAFTPKIKDYAKTRDYPYLNGTSNLSVYLRFGNLSVRDLLRAAVKEQVIEKNTWVSEIIWRDFYHMILSFYPQVVKFCFKADYEKIKWPSDPKLFKAWSEGKTGYPIVDAAMRELNQTGMMHNRLRMIVASFLCKTLLVDWRLGERYFAQKLLDYDLAANNGGWQWSSSTGCDAQPYFRIFNPFLQSKKFDPEGLYIKQWCPELKTIPVLHIHNPHKYSLPNYPAPIVSYERNRKEALALFRQIKH